MPNVEISLPARIGEYVFPRMDAFGSQAALVMAFRVVRPRFVLGGLRDNALEVSLQVMTVQGEELWVYQDEVTGFGAPAMVTIFLPFLAGDAVLVAPTHVPGMIRSWVATGRRLETSVRYRVHLTGTPNEHEVEVNTHDLEPRYSD